MLNKRTNILFNNELWEKLTKLTQMRNISVGSFVREAVEEKLAEEEKLIRRKDAIESTLKNRVHLKGKVDYKELINYGRKY